jgi:serine/threonine-protein kinase
MQAVDGSASNGPATANGHSYSHALSLTEYFGVNPSVQFNLGRSWKRLTGAVSVQDTAEATTKAKFKILLDGREALAGDLALGSEVPVDLDVTGVLRLSFQIDNMTPGDCILCGPGGGPFIWGNPMVSR